jgi:hypothetical protein
LMQRLEILNALYARMQARHTQFLQEAIRYDSGNHENKIS